MFPRGTGRHGGPWLVLDGGAATRPAEEGRGLPRPLTLEWSGLGGAGQGSHTPYERVHV